MKRTYKVVLLALVLILSAGMIFANGTSDDVVKIGLSISDYETERWSNEEAILRQLFEERGCEVITQVANHDAKLQNDQIDNMVTLGCDVIIVVAEDGAAAATAVDEAAADGVMVIAYDRLVKSANLAAYISFDNVEVGRTQARGVLDVVDSGKFILLGGSPTDNNAVLFRKGQMEVLQPLIDSGQIEIVGDQWVENWSDATATTKMENLLTAVSNDVDAVVASNDGTALGALQAMKAQGLAGSVPISGQDATMAGCKSIVEGELTMTVFKDIRKLAPLAVETAMALAEGKTVPGMTTYSLAELTGEDKAGNVPCKFLEVIGVNADNVYEEVILSGFQSYDDVYKDIPEGDRPPRP